jgi:hypothetical protein
MLVYQATPGPVNCRSVSVPACERDYDAGKSSSIEALALFQLKLRDTIDFTVDFTDWLVANGAATLTGATFSVAADSPQTPTIAGQTFNAGGKSIVVLSPAANANVGDAYYLDIIAQVAATIVSLPTDIAIPARTLVRRINVIVVHG